MSQNYTLLELNKEVQQEIKNSFPDNVWVVAEISEIKVNRNGHCYLELIEKDVISDNIIARARATIWAFTFRLLKPYFETSTGQNLIEGIKILVNVSIEFHELYGFSLNITDIDPTYTIGDLAKQKKETLEKLAQEGVIDMNKELSVPIAPQKIAVISSETAAGYQDFIDQLVNNNYDYKFYLKLFPATMQGKAAEKSIITSLERIYEYDELFDCVVIIRGGGSQADLSCFDSYSLALNIAQFPLPILTGIGHDKDESVVDIVANQQLKTPTAVAEFLIDQLKQIEAQLIEYKLALSSIAHNILLNHKSRLKNLSLLTKPIIYRALEKHKNSLLNYSDKTKLYTQAFLSGKAKMHEIIVYQAQAHSRTLLLKRTSKNKELTQKLVLLSKQFIEKNDQVLRDAKNKLNYISPENILSRGYSITYCNGKVVQNSDDINKGDQLLTKLKKGEILSTVNKHNKG